MEMYIYLISLFIIINILMSEYVINLTLIIDKLLVNMVKSKK